MRIKHQTGDWTGARGTSEERRYKRPLALTTLIAAHITLLPLWNLLWIMIPLSIWLEDQGPTYYIQQQVRQRGLIFGMFKFRSMRVKQDREGWPGVALSDKSFNPNRNNKALVAIAAIPYLAH